MADWQSLDPEAAREAEKYDNPIPSRELILQRLDERGAPAGREELAEEFGLHEEEQIEALRRRLRAMERDGQLIHTRRGTYAPVDKLDLVLGRVSGHRDGFGFLIPDDGSDDLFLSPMQMRLLFDGDRALARVSGFDRRGRREGAIVEVVSRAHETVVGRYYEESGIGFVIPDNPKIQQEVLVTPGRTANASVGQFVEIRITHWPTLRFQPQGDIIEVIGNYMAPGMEIEVALRSYDIPHVWPEAVLKESRKLKPEVDEKDKLKRIDLRHLPFVTIDGEDARDFDDAVYCEKSLLAPFAGGYRLYVAIADVSHYVRVGSALDEEASRRGNSVYFPERVVPMLPEELSNGLCSLNPQVDRLAMVCEMTLSRAGKMTDYQFYEAVIHSHARLTYNRVSAMLEQPKSPEGKRLRSIYAGVLPHLKQLHSLYKVLVKARQARGAIDFETQETRIVFGTGRKIAEILPTERNDAHKLIEECMLCANVATAAFLQKHELPGLYRVHDGPPAERLEKLKAFLGELGLSLHRSKDGPTPKDYQMLLESIQGRADFHLIQTVMLRSLSQAVYSAENRGHFGLNYEAYAHFTSPIRRYPDLLVHRAIRSVIRSKRETPHVRRAGATSMPKARIYPYEEAALEQLGESCSMTERRADEATRDVVNWLKCEFMQDRVGERFDGVISAATGFGIFVELKDIYVEGLVHVTALPADYYHFDPVHHCLSGERSGRSFRLGDSVVVQVMRVDLDERRIDFELIEGGRGRMAGRRRDSEPPEESVEERTVKGSGKRAKGDKAKGLVPLASELLAQAEAMLGNTDVKRSRVTKQALLAEAKDAKTERRKTAKAPAGKSSAKQSKPAGKGPSRKGRSKAGT
ncbi:ribonuclease R [Azorhizophilus paspali]|uniref:Ribonuclease R n=1 Tax=Azorhizophilus paspali TaxID=69963 RepID=A0ABV6SQR9_AZOPA